MDKRYEKLKQLNKFINDLWAVLLKEYLFRKMTNGEMNTEINLVSELFKKYDKLPICNKILMAVQEEIHEQQKEFANE